MLDVGSINELVQVVLFRNLPGLPFPGSEKEVSLGKKGSLGRLVLGDCGACVTVKIARNPQAKDERRAHALFNHPEARRFFWLLGGDQLRKGERNFTSISEKYDKTIYAAYANLALGDNLTYPFYYVDEDGALSVRPEKPALAGAYLSKVNVDHLPPSYRNILDSLCKRVHCTPRGNGSRQEVRAQHERDLSRSAR